MGSLLSKSVWFMTPKLLNVFRAVGVHRIWAGLFRRRNIRASNNDALGRRFPAGAGAPGGGGGF